MDTISSLQFSAGFSNIIRLRANPVMNITMNSDATAINQLQSELRLSGVCNNINQVLTCQITWIIDKSGEERYEVDHTGEIVLRFLSQTSSQEMPAVSETEKLKNIPCIFCEKNKQRFKDSIALNSYELGLYGKGKLGYRIKFPLYPSLNLEILPEKSGITFNLTLEIAFQLADQVPFNPGKEKLSIGTPVSIQVTNAAVFDNHMLKVALWETDLSDSKKENAPKDAISTMWKLPINSTTDTALRVGISGGSDAAAIINYGNDIETDNNLSFNYEITLLDALGQPINNVHAVRSGKFCNADQPELKSFSVAIAPKKENDPENALSVVINGEFNNFSSQLSFPVEVRLYTYIAAVPEDSASMVQVAPFSKSIQILVTDNKFTSTIQLTKEQGQDFNSNTGMQLFGVLSFPFECASDGNQKRPFASIVSFKPNMKDSLKETGFAPFKSGLFTTINNATGVCSDLIDIGNNITDLASGGKGGYTELVDALADKESSNDYSAITESGSYFGRYQFGRPLLFDLQEQPNIIVKRIAPGSGNSSFRWIDGYTNEMFFSDHDLQDWLIRKQVTKKLKWIKANCSEYIGEHRILPVSYISKTLNITIADVWITYSGLVCAAHLVGQDKIMPFLQSNIDSSDGNGTHLSEYMYRFGGYDLSEIDTEIV